MPNSHEVVQAKVALPWVTLEGSEKFYKLDEQELEFFRTATCIDDEAALRAHMIHVQREAYAVRFPRISLARCELIIHLLRYMPSRAFGCSHSPSRFLGLGNTVRLSSCLACRLKLARLPRYDKILTLGKTRKNPIFLDIGCCCER